MKEHRDALGRIFFGLIIIWLGISLFLRRLDYFYFGNGEWWAYFLFGVGIIFLVEAVVRSIRVKYERLSIGKTIAGIILIAIGAGNIYNLENWWPFILIVMGIIIIISNLRQKDEDDQETKA